MKIWMTLFTFSLLLFSCNNSTERELELKAKELELKERELNLKALDNSEKHFPSNVDVENGNGKATQAETENQPEATKAVSKYGFVAFLVEVPRLEHIAGSMGFQGISDDIEEFNHIIWEKQVYTSAIIELNNYNEDKKYQLLEEATSDFKRNKLIWLANDFKSDIVFKVKDQSWRSANQNVEARFVNKKVLVFDSYKSASLAKSDGINF